MSFSAIEDAHSAKSSTRHNAEISEFTEESHAHKNSNNFFAKPVH